MTDINEIIGRAMRVDAWALHHSPSGTWSYVGPYSKDDFVRPGSGYRAEALTKVEDIGAAVVKALAEAGYEIGPKFRYESIEMKIKDTKITPEQLAEAMKGKPE